MLHDQNKLLFPDVERARGMVRTYRGNHGDMLRGRNCGCKEFYRPGGKQTDALDQLPAPLPDNKPWNIVPISFKRALVVCDLHIPHHDGPAVKLALREGKRWGVDTIILLGDIVDFYAVSYWDRQPDRKLLADEVEYGKRFLECLRESFPKAQIIYKEGNHEEGLWRFLWSRCAELFGLRDAEGKQIFSLSSLLDFDGYGVQEVAMKKPLRAGPHLHMLHGHEFGKPIERSVNPARGLALRARCNALIGHLHVCSNHTEPGLDKTMSTWSVGCLCELHPPYAPINRWSTGFGLCELHGENWSYHNRKIINGIIV
jgi:predicted phosphodiesterase